MNWAELLPSILRFWCPAYRIDFTKLYCDMILSAWTEECIKKTTVEVFVVCAVKRLLPLSLYRSFLPSLLFLLSSYLWNYCSVPYTVSSFWRISVKKSHLNLRNKKSCATTDQLVIYMSVCVSVHLCIW